ncbi:hypothetical protein [Cyclonatronum sp.]|nr:hypothetical protein [Cyclonatronum sp.]
MTFGSDSGQARVCDARYRGLSTAPPNTTQTEGDLQQIEDSR